MKNLVVLFFAFIILTTSSISCLTQAGYKHKTEAELEKLSPAQRVEEMVKEQYYHYPINAGHDDDSIRLDHIREDGAKALPALTDIANQYDPTKPSDWEESRLDTAFLLADDIDNIVIRIRAINEGRALINALEGVLNRMKAAGYGSKEHRWHRAYLIYSDDLKTLQGKDYSRIDEYIRSSLSEKHKIQISDKELIRFSNYLTSLDPNYPSRCKIRFPPPPLLCKDSSEYYEAYLKFKAQGKPPVK